jgi:hypothetical protein
MSWLEKLFESKTTTRKVHLSLNLKMIMCYVDENIEHNLNHMINSSQRCQFRFVLFGMAETFHINLKNRKKWNNFYLISNLGPFRIFWINFGWNVPVSFHMFRSTLEKLLNQIKPGSIWLIKPPKYKL